MSIVVTQSGVLQIYETRTGKNVKDLFKIGYYDAKKGEEVDECCHDTPPDLDMEQDDE